MYDPLSCQQNVKSIRSGNSVMLTTIKVDWWHCTLQVAEWPCLSISPQNFLWCFWLISCSIHNLILLWVTGLKNLSKLLSCTQMWLLDIKLILQAPEVTWNSFLQDFDDWIKVICSHSSLVRLGNRACLTVRILVNPKGVELRALCRPAEFFHTKLGLYWPGFVHGTIIMFKQMALSKLLLKSGTGCV